MSTLSEEHRAEILRLAKLLALAHARVAGEKARLMCMTAKEKKALVSSAEDRLKIYLRQL